MTKRGPKSSRYHTHPCLCHRVCLGHHYGEDLVCENGTCRRSWFEEQENPTECRGLWVHRHTFSETMQRLVEEIDAGVYL